jgi:hypothetical protein
MAICRDLRDAAEVIRREQSGQDTGPRQLAAYLEQLDETECARVRVNSPLWKTWRRLMQHRTLTGHSLPVLPLPQGALSNPN